MALRNRSVEERKREEGRKKEKEEGRKKRKKKVSLFTLREERIQSSAASL